MDNERKRILVVDDDRHIAELVSLYLNKEGFETKEVYNGREVLDAYREFRPDLLVLDLMLPGTDGYSICRELRKFSKTPVIMLTAKGDVFDKVLGLELGADDYMVKPFDGKELVARVKAVLRRFEQGQETPTDEIVLENLVINSTNYTVTYRGKQVDFPLKEFEVLQFLARNPNQVFTREQLLDRIWGYEYPGDTRTVDVHIKRIREKLGEEKTWGIRTVRGVGYKFEVIH